MFVRSGVPGELKGTDLQVSGLVFISGPGMCVDIVVKRSWDVHKKYIGGYAITLFSTDGEEENTLFIGSIRECITQMNGLVSAIAKGYPIYNFPNSRRL